MNTREPHSGILEFMRDWLDEPQLGTGKRSVTSDTTLERNLGISGEDALDFMDDFFRHFDTVPTGFRHANFFSPEGTYVPIMTNLLRLIVGNRPLQRRPVYDLTIGDLERVVGAKKWINPPDLRPDSRFD